jgi:hypothetical protein
VRIGFSIAFGAGLVGLQLAFLLSLPVWNSMFLYYNALTEFGASSIGCINSVAWIALYGILPIATSLAILIFAHIKERKTLLEGLGHWLFNFFGAFCILWGLLYIVASCFFYLAAVGRLGVSGIDFSILMVYLTYGLAGMLWMIAGIFLARLYLRPLETRESREDYESQHPVRRTDSKFYGVLTTTRGV